MTAARDKAMGVNFELDQARRNALGTSCCAQDPIQITLSALMRDYDSDISYPYSSSNRFSTSRTHKAVSSDEILLIVHEHE